MCYNLKCTVQHYYTNIAITCTEVALILYHLNSCLSKVMTSDIYVRLRVIISVLWAMGGFDKGISPVDQINSALRYW